METNTLSVYVYVCVCKQMSLPEIIPFTQHKEMHF